MASCLDIVNGTLRKIGVLASGREARAVDRDDTFEALKGLYRQLINNGTFGRLNDVTPISDYVAGENERIFRNSDAVLEITLPETVTVCDGETLTPLDCAVVVIVDAFSGTTADFIYDGHIKKWQGLYDLAITDDAPLSFRDPQGLMALLGLQIVDDFGGQMGDATIRLARNFQTSLVSRYSMPVTETPGVYY